MSKADQIHQGLQDNYVNVEERGYMFVMLALRIVKDRTKVEEIYQSSAVAVKLGFFDGSVEELAMKSCILMMAEEKYFQQAPYIVMDAINEDTRSATKIICDDVTNSSFNSVNASRAFM